MYKWDQELYYRLEVHIHKKVLEQQLESKRPNPDLFSRGSKHPLVVRNDEELKYYTGRKALDQISWILLLIFVNEDNDFALIKQISHSIRVAEKHQFQGRWNFFNELIKYFNFSSLSKNYKEINDYSVETIFCRPEFAEFLQTQFKDDEIFGNLIPRALSLTNQIKIRELPKSSINPFALVIKPQRHRGYRDKGYSAELRKGWKIGQSSSRREANTLYEDYDSPAIIDPLAHITNWGSELTLEEKLAKETSCPKKKKRRRRKKKKKKENEGGGV